MVAIILVNYNGADDTIECIKSLKKVKEPEYMIIVVDNCSNDDSIKRLKKEQRYNDFVLLQASSNAGFSAGNNLGIRYAIGKEADYYLLLNNDTIVETDFLKNLINGFEASKTCGVTISKILYHSSPDIIWYAGGRLNKKTARTEHYKFNEKDSINDSTLKKVTFASGCCMCLSKKVVEKIGFLNEDFFLYEEDAEYCYRIIDAGFDIYYIPKSVVYHKVSASTGQGSPISQYYAVRNKYYFIHQCFKGIDKITAYLYCTAQFLFRCFKHEQNFKYYKYGFYAFLRKEIGKTKGEI